MSPRPRECDRCQNTSELHRINIPDSHQFYLICHACIVALVCADMKEPMSPRTSHKDRKGWGLGRNFNKDNQPCACCTDPNEALMCPWCSKHCHFNNETGRWNHSDHPLDDMLDREGA